MLLIKPLFQNQPFLQQLPTSTKVSLLAGIETAKPNVKASNPITAKVLDPDTRLR